MTHLFNAMPAWHHREPGVVGAVCTHATATAEIIADGFHVHPAAIALAARALGTDRLALITDCVEAGGRPPGTYDLAGQAIHYDGHQVVLPDGTLAGSALTMEVAVRNMVQFAGVSILDAVKMATQVPATILGLHHRKGRLAAGFEADFLRLDAQNLQVKDVWIAGKPLSA